TVTVSSRVPTSTSGASTSYSGMLPPCTSTSGSSPSSVCSTSHPHATTAARATSARFRTTFMVPPYSGHPEPVTNQAVQQTCHAPGRSGGCRASPRVVGCPAFEAGGKRFMELRDKTIVITGAARGLGAAMATRLAAQKPRLALVDLKAEDIAGTAA